MSSTAETPPLPAREDLLTVIPLSQLERARELISATQRLSLARSVADVQAIVRTSARRLTRADGATFVLRDGDQCFYADEDAISPLWKGQRFPLTACISGWVMLNRRPAVIEDIYADHRIPHDAYRPTFVKSLAMVPIRTLDPIGAIGNYWARRHVPDEEDLELLQALADSTAMAMENVRVYGDLEQRVADRTAELQARTLELEETTRSIRALYDESARNFDALRERNEHHLRVLNTLAHEVRTPLAAGRGILRLTTGPGNTLDRFVLGDLTDVDSAFTEAIEIVNRQLEEARSESRTLALHVEELDVAAELAQLRVMFRALPRSDDVRLVVEEPPQPLILQTDRTLLGHVLRNLVSNALKFTDRGEVRVRTSGLGAALQAVSFTVADTGIGIELDDVDRIFEQWEQVRGAQPDRPLGSGLGLPLVRRLVDSLGGAINVHSEPGHGSEFTVVLPARSPERTGPERSGPEDPAS